MATYRNFYSDKPQKDEDGKMFPPLCDEYYYSFCRQYGIDPVVEDSTPKKGNYRGNNRLKTLEGKEYKSERMPKSVKSHMKDPTRISRRNIGREISSGRHFLDTVTRTREFEIGMIERKKNLMGRVHDQLLNVLRERNESYQDFLQFLNGNKNIPRDRKVDLSWCVTSQRSELMRHDRDWNITMDKLLRIEKEPEDSEDDDCFVPRKLFFFHVDTFKRTFPDQGTGNKTLKRKTHKRKKAKTEKNSALDALLTAPKKTHEPEQQKKKKSTIKGKIIRFFGLRRR